MKTLLIITSLFLASLTTAPVKRDCQTSEAEQYNGGGYVQNGKLYLWKRQGKEIVVFSTSNGDCNDLAAAAKSNNWVMVK